MIRENAIYVTTTELVFIQRLPPSALRQALPLTRITNQTFFVGTIERDPKTGIGTDFVSACTKPEVEQVISNTVASGAVDFDNAEPALKKLWASFVKQQRESVQILIHENTEPVADWRCTIS